MKKTLFALAAGCISIVALTPGLNAQNTKNVLVFADTKTFMQSLETVFPTDNTIIISDVAPRDAKAISAKAMKDFQNRFSKIADAKWYTISDGFLSYFSVDGVTNRVYYDKKGRWQFNLKHYSEEKLPRDIRKVVKSTYFDYTITGIEEVESHDNLVYIVHLEDPTSIKNVRVSKDGEMDVMQEFTKG